MRMICVMLVFGLSGCGGLDRMEAARLISAAHFGTSHGLVVHLSFPPSAVMRHISMLGDFSTPIGDCAQSTIGWRNQYTGAIECVRALASVGVVRSCGSAQFHESSADGATIASPTPLAMGRGREPLGADIRMPAGGGPGGPPMFVVSFDSMALPSDRCRTFLSRSETAVLNARSDRGDWVSASVTIPGSTTFVDVTGIADGPSDTKIAEFTWAADMARIAPLMDAQACLLASGAWPTAEPHTARATLRHFDDGWRVESVDWAGH